MTQKTKKQFGAWMDTHHATVVGHNPEGTAFTVIGFAKNAGPDSNSSENAANNHEITLVQKYFKEIGHRLVNAEEAHITGSGTIQEQFMRYVGEAPQFKRTVTSESTSRPMSEEKLVEFVGSHFK